MAQSIRLEHRLAAAPGGLAPRSAGLAALASLLLHLALGTALVVAVPRGYPRSADADDLVWLEPVPGTGARAPAPGPARPATARPPTPPPKPRDFGRREARQNVDALHRGGAGADVGPAEVVLLLPRRDRLTGLDAPWNARDSRQMQRIRTAPDRATRTDRRATPNPGSTPFLASRSGPGRERHPVGRPAQEGRPRAPTPERGAPDPPAPQGGVGLPGAVPAPAAGPAERRGRPASQGEEATALLPAASGRPPVPEGDAATPSDWRSPRVRDNRDAELLAADLTRAMLTTTGRQGRRPGEGAGGVAGPGAAGAGRQGTEEGGRSQPHAPGPGEDGALDTRDPRYVRWLLRLRRRVEARLEFPRERALRLDQGTALYRVRLRRDGRLAAPPELLRTSGFQDFDRHARRALEAALPAGALPPDLAPRFEVVPFTVPVQFWNPMVR